MRLARPFLAWLCLSVGCGTDDPGGEVFASTTTGEVSTSEPPTTTATSTSDPIPVTTSGETDSVSGTGTTSGDSSGDGFACTPKLAWIRQFPGTGQPQSFVPRNVAVDAAGDVLFAGSFMGETDLGDGPAMATDNWEDAYLAKFTGEGELVWTRHFEGEGEQSMIGLATAPNGDLLIGGRYWGTIDLGGGPLPTSAKADGWIARLTADGGHLWSQAFGNGGMDRLVALASDHDGNVALIADSDTSLIFAGELVDGPPGNKGFVVSLDPAGMHRWSRAFGSSVAEPTFIESLAVDVDGGVFVGGHLSGSVDLGGGPVSSGEGPGVFLGHYDIDGDFVYHHVSSGTGVGEVFSLPGLATDALGRARVGGRFAGKLDLGGDLMVSTGKDDGFLAVLEPDGTHAWSSHLSGIAGGEEDVTDLASDAAGNTVAIGLFETSLHLATTTLQGQDVASTYVAFFDPDGQLTGSLVFGSSTALVFLAVALDAAGDAYITGTFSSDLTVDGQQSVSLMQSDTFLLKVSACPPPPPNDGAAPGQIPRHM